MFDFSMWNLEYKKRCIFSSFGDHLIPEPWGNAPVTAMVVTALE